MAITPTTYNLAPGWSLADWVAALGDALTAAGVDNLYENTNAGQESCIFGNDRTADTYGTRSHRIWTLSNQIYYGGYTRFNYTTNGVEGDLYEDYSSTSLTSTTGMVNLCGYDQLTSGFFRIWTSTVDTNFHVIEFQNGGNHFVFWMTPKTVTMNSWVNFNNRSFNDLYFPAFGWAQYHGFWYPAQTHCLPRDIQLGAGGTWTSTSYPMGTFHTQFRYHLSGNFLGTSTNAFPYANQSDWFGASVNPLVYISAPAGNERNDASLTTGQIYRPMIKGMAYSGYCDATIPSDFGVVPTGSNALSNGDNFIVTAGVEEYETISCSNNSAGNTTYTSGAFVARTV